MTKKNSPPEPKTIPANKTTRNQRGKVDGTVMFPTAPPKAELPESYTSWLAELKSNIAKTRLKVILNANSDMVLLYWSIGARILEKQQTEGWGARIIDRLAHDLREAFPDMKGFSPRNLKYMRAFATAWPNFDIVQEVLAQLPWYHNIALLEKLGTEEERLWYAKNAYEYGWSRNILAMQIEVKAHMRQGKAQNNFPKTLPVTDSDMAVQVFKDPYLFDFLGTDAPRREAELERGLVSHIQKFLLELGQGFAFVGQQVHLELGDQDFYLDLLFYHLKLRCYVVLEIKARKFEVGDGAQLGMYMTAVDKLLKHPDDKLTLGLLLVRGKNEILVEYALGSMNKPMSVAEWETQLTQSLPDNLQASLPTVEELEAELKKDDGLDHNSALSTQEKLLEQQRRLKEKEAVLKARIAKLEAREKAAEQKKDTRRKILLGAFMLKKMQDLPSFRNQITQELNGFLKNARDRELFGLSTKEENHHETV